MKCPKCRSEMYSNKCDECSSDKRDYEEILRQLGDSEENMCRILMSHIDRLWSRVLELEAALKSSGLKMGLDSGTVKIENAQSFWEALGYVVYKDYHMQGGRPIDYWELRDGRFGTIQVDERATIEAMLEDMPLLFDGKPGTSPIDYEIRGELDGIKELHRRIKHAVDIKEKAHAPSSTAQAPHP